MSSQGSLVARVLKKKHLPPNTHHPQLLSIFTLKVSYWHTIFYKPHLHFITTTNFDPHFGLPLFSLQDPTKTMASTSASSGTQPHYLLVLPLRSPCVNPKGSLLLSQLNRDTNDQQITRLPRQGLGTQMPASPADGVPQPGEEMRALGLGGWWAAFLRFTRLVGKAKYVPIDSGRILIMYPPNLVFPRI